MLTMEERRFIKNNREYWSPYKIKINGDKIILVEGQLFGAPNYLLRAVTSAKAIQRATGYEIAIIVDCSEDSLKVIKKLCRPFGIKKFINVWEMSVPIHIKFMAGIKCVGLLLKNDPNEILKLSYRGINMGHLVYDDILHDDIGNNKRKKHYTINRVDLYCIKHIYKFFVKAYIYYKLLEEHNVSSYVSTHTEYIEYGIPPFLAVDQQIPVIYSTDFTYAIIENSKDLFAQDRIKKALIDIINSNSKEDLIREAEIKIKKRMEGHDNRDAKLAYSNEATSYARENLKNKLGINNQNPIVFIFAHVFRDAPHTSSRMLYRDYYDWLEDTLICANEIQDVNWILKEHPAGERIYKEKGVVQEIIKKRKLSNIYICPSDFNNASLGEVADAVLTCEGTIGIECSCMGIPAVICGNALYAGFGFTIEPKSIGQYRSILKRMNRIKKLSANQIEKAKIVYAATQRCYGNELVLLDEDILNYIWGYEQERNVQEAYKLINEKFDQLEFLGSSLYQDVYNYFKLKKDAIYEKTEN